MMSFLHEFVSKLPALDLTLKMAPEQYEDRIERVRDELRKRDLDAGIAYGNELRPGDTGWLTGYDPHIESTCVIIGPQKVLVLGGPEGKAYAEEMMKVGEFRCVDELKIPEEDYPGFEFHTLNDLFTESAGRKVRRVGILTSKGVIPCSILELAQHVGAVDVVDASDILLQARYTKTVNEQKMMRVAAQISCYGVQVMIEAIKPGMRETQLAAWADYIMKYMGADRLGVNTIVMSGERCSTVIGRASNRVIEKGDLTVLGTSARYEGLASAVGRTVVAGGEPSEAQLQLIESGSRAYELCVERLAYGAPASGVDLAAREYLRKLGLEPMYSVVHGIGWTECMEGTGAATQYSKYTFPKNVSVMVDVGIFGVPFKYLDAKKVGFRMEDPYLIDGKGKTERLVSMPVRVYDLVSKG